MSAAAAARGKRREHEEGVTAKNSSATKTDGASPSRMIDGRIKELGDWRGETLADPRR